MNWAEFFNMGGYAAYVWSSWGLSLAAFIYLVLQAKIKKKQLIQQLQRQAEREKLI